jgi:hypothetical protein
MDEQSYADRTEAGVWVITDADWPLSVRLAATWKPGRYGWEISYRAGASVIPPTTAFKITIP